MLIHLLRQVILLGILVGILLTILRAPRRLKEHNALVLATELDDQNVCQNEDNAKEACSHIDSSVCGISEIHGIVEVCHERLVYEHVIESKVPHEGNAAGVDPLAWVYTGGDKHITREPC